MITSQIIGGLGNQMFQYAAGRAVSVASSQSFALDTTAFSKYQLHQGFELKHVFALSTPEISRPVLRQRYGWRTSPLALRLAQRWPRFPLVNPGVVIEPHFDYWNGILNVSKSAYLSGYWQSERYFSAISDLIRQDFCFSNPFRDQEINWINKIERDNAVSLHVRRGDYVNNPINLALHGVSSLNYYRRAIHTILERVNNPTFYVFSDDLPWARSNLNIDAPVYFVEGNSGRSSYRDLQFMSLCKHNIIANSTFSWWGAWLNSNPKKVVVAPQNWFVRQPQPTDIYPLSWIVL